MRVSSQSFSSALQVFISSQRGSSPQRSDDHNDIFLPLSLSLSRARARARSPLAEEFLSSPTIPDHFASPVVNDGQKLSPLSRSRRPRKGRRRSLRAGSGGAAQHNGAPLHDRSLARAFVHLLPSFRPSVTPTRALSMCLRVFPRKAISLSLFH